jgi:hypothetical protein
MNQRLTESRVRETCRALLQINPALSGRGFCAELKRRFGAVGKTEREFAIWRDEISAAAMPPDTVELQKRLAAVEAAAAENLARAERAELREEKHQEMWAMEVDRLRQELQAGKSGATEVRVLQERVLQLSRELMAARATG